LLRNLLFLYENPSIISNIITCQREAIHSTHIIISLFIFLIILHISPHVEKEVTKNSFFSFLFSSHEGNEEKRIYENIIGTENNKAWTVERERESDFRKVERLQESFIFDEGWFSIVPLLKFISMVENEWRWMISYNNKCLTWHPHLDFNKNTIRFTIYVWMNTQRIYLCIYVRIRVDMGKIGSVHEMIFQVAKYNNFGHSSYFEIASV